MPRAAIRSAAALLLACACAAPAPGATVERFPDRSPWILGLELGWAKVAMDDINAAVREFNANPDVGDMPEIDDAVDFGVSLGRRLSPSLTAGLKFTRLDASTDLPDPLGAFEINVGANVWGAYLHWIPPLEGGLAWGAGLDAGLLATTGELDLAIPGQGTESGGFDGTAPAGAAYLVIEGLGTRTVSFQGHVGYRYAKITDLELAGGPAADDLDYSGFFIRAAFRLHP